MSGRARLVTRLYLAAPAWSAVTGILVALVTGVLVAAPRAATAAADVELRRALAELQGPARDLAAEVAGRFEPGPGSAPTLDPENAQVYGALDEQLAALRETAQPALRERLGGIDYLARGGTLTAPHRDEPEDVPIGSIRLAFDPRIAERVEIVEGAAPSPADETYTLDPVTEQLLHVVEIMMSADSAETLGWEIGASRIVRETGLEVRLTGVFAPVDPDALVWQHVPSILAAQEFDDGNAPPRATATVFVAPGTLATVPWTTSSVRLTAWFPLDASRLSLAEAQTIVAELRRFTNQREGIAAIGGGSLRFDSGALDAMERVIARSDSTTSLLLLVGGGPLGVAGAVLGLAAHGVVIARRPALALAAARGGSPGSLRAALALEGLAVGIPGAALGLFAGLLLTPGPWHWSSFLVAAVVGIAPATVFALRASFPLRRADRQDLGASTRSRLRLALDLVVVGLAVLSTVLLLTGGGRTDGGVDVLAVLAPLLLAIAGALLGERLLPAPASAALRRAAAGPRLAGFLGLARAVRDPSGSVANLALVVAIAVTAGSAVLLTTVDRGTTEAATATLGGDLRAEGAPLGAEALDDLAGIPGIAAVAGIEAIGSVTFSHGSERLQVPAYVVDGEALAAIQAGFPGGLASGEEPVPFVASPELAAELSGDEMTIEGVAAELLGSAGGAAGVGGGPWLMVDRSASDTIGAGAFAPRIVVAALQPGAEAAAVAEELRAATGDARVTTLDDRIAAQRATPIPAVLRTGFALAITLSALLAVVAIGMSARLAAERRATLSRTLGRLGADRRTIGATVAIEAVPALVATLVLGGVLGAAIPFLVVAAVDLGPIVGGLAPPALVADPLVLALIAVGAAAAALLSLAPVLVSSRKESA